MLDYVIGRPREICQVRFSPVTNSFMFWNCVSLFLMHGITASRTLLFWKYSDVIRRALSRLSPTRVPLQTLASSCCYTHVLIFVYDLGAPVLGLCNLCLQILWSCARSSHSRVAKGKRDVRDSGLRRDCLRCPKFPSIP